MRISRTRARRLALQGLYEWQVSGNSPKDIEQQFLIEHHSRKFDRSYFNELLNGVTNQVEWLDGEISPLSDRPYDEVDLVEKEGLRNPIRRKAILRSCEVVYAA